MNIEEFRLAWRWTQPSHTVLPPQVLASITPLSAHEAARLYNYGAELFGQHVHTAVTHQCSDDSETTRIWLEDLSIRRDHRMFVVWDRATAVTLPWGTFTTYWDDFCYPSSDDVYVLPEIDGSVLAWSHEEVFKFVEYTIVR